MMLGSRMVLVVAILASLTATSKGLSRVLVSPENTVADAGDRLLLPCVAFTTTTSDTDDSAATSPAISISLIWKRGSQVLQNSSRIVIHESVSTLTRGSNGRRAVSIKSVLEICGVEREDHGEYSCSVVASGAAADDDGGGSAGQLEEQDMATFKLHVITAPAIVLVASNTTNDTNGDPPNSNATLFLSVVGFGLPLPKVTWLRNGHDISNSIPPPHTEIRNDVILRGGQKFVRSTLILALCDDMANRELIGEYTCVVENDMRTSQVTLDVTAPTPIGLKSGPPPTPINTLKVGENRSFTCEFYGFPWPAITWTRNTSHGPITTRGRFSVQTHQVISSGFRFTRSVLEINTAIESIEGEFSCKASNKDNATVTVQFTINVLIPPRIVVAPTCLINMVAMPNINQTFVVTCVALGSPRPTLQWWTQNSTGTKTLRNSTYTPIIETVKIHEGIEFVQSHLLLSGAERQSDTNYSCTAANTAGSKSSLFKICAIGVIEMLVAPSDQTVNKGDGVFLPCVVLSQHTDGVTTVTWKRNRKQDGENSAEELKNTTKKVTVFQSEEQKGKGHTLIRSILYLGCVSEEDVGTYSCHVANNDATKTTSFMIDITGPGLPPTSGFGNRDQLNHAGYIGSLTTNILLLSVIAVYLVFRKLRTSSTGVPLINLCSSLVALNFSYIISLVLANRSGMGESGCGFLAALFHYLLLVGSFAFAVMVTFVLTKRDNWRRKVKIVFYVVAFVANWGSPVLIVSISAASNVSNYSSGLTTFCGPVNWALYLGVAFPVIVVHLVTLILLLLLPFLSEKVKSYIKQREMLGVGVTLVLFDLIWGIGLSSIVVPPESSTQMTLQNVFIIASAVHGLLIVFFFGVLSKKVREELLFCRRSKSDPKSKDDEAKRAEDGLSGCNFTNLDSSVDSETVFIPHRKMSTGSLGCPPSPGVDSVQSYPVHFKAATLEPIQEHQSDC